MSKTRERRAIARLCSYGLSRCRCLALPTASLLALGAPCCRAQIPESCSTFHRPILIDDSLVRGRALSSLKTHFERKRDFSAMDGARDRSLAEESLVLSGQLLSLLLEREHRRPGACISLNLERPGPGDIYFVWGRSTGSIRVGRLLSGRPSCCPGPIGLPAKISFAFDSVSLSGACERDPHVTAFILYCKQQLDLVVPHSHVYRITALPAGDRTSEIFALFLDCQLGFILAIV